MSIASHLETDLLKIAKDVEFSVNVRTLGSNTSLMTMIANDYSHENVFASELEMLGKSKDKLIVISSSGNSLNVVKAVEQANRMDMESYSLIGFSHSKAENLAQFSLNLNLNEGEYATAEDVHSVICHAISEKVKSLILKKEV